MGKEKDRDLSHRVENTAPTTQSLSNLSKHQPKTGILKISN